MHTAQQATKIEDLAPTPAHDELCERRALDPLLPFLASLRAARVPADVRALSRYLSEIGA